MIGSARKMVDRIMQESEIFHQDHLLAQVGKALTHALFS
jgi:hypothetical protein